MTDETHAHEIVIIKRHGGHEDAHHGGVWKIAFADFMTAMMAFFLVMWLISANDKTKAVIARYFNPLELVDSTPQPPGLDDAKKGGPKPQHESKKPTEAQAKASKPEAKIEAAGADTADKPVADAAATASHDEADLTRDPYAVLAEVATLGNREAPEKTNEKRLEDAQRGIGAQGLKGGEAFRDPFEPVQGGPSEPSTDSEAPARPQAAPDRPGKALAAAAPPAEAPAAPAAQAKADDQPSSAVALRAKIAALAKATDGAGAGGPKLEVRQTSEGLLVSLTDSADFAMFPTASARPAPKTLAMVEKVAQLLKSQKGSITVRGFTDSRPFRSEAYDNWRLSTARAQIAHYMLVRGGVSDSRIDHVEGYADRRPKNPKNPEAAENRRIEILLRDPTP